MRCYNGCPDSALKRKMEHDYQIKKRLYKMGVRAVYFPAENQFLAFHGNVLVGEMQDSLDDILDWCINNLKLGGEDEIQKR